MDEFYSSQDDTLLDREFDDTLSLIDTLHISPEREIEEFDEVF